MNGTPSTRYHAEIKLTVEGKEARINVFADTLNEVFSDLAKITIQYDDLHSAAKREILNAELKAKQLRQNGTLPDKGANNDGLGPTAVCPSCGSTNTELIEWTDKETGKPRRAWKCQDCKRWLPRSKKA
jgi:hypothetical protein